jgi:hypothetical protein
MLRTDSKSQFYRNLRFAEGEYLNSGELTASVRQTTTLNYRDGRRRFLFSMNGRIARPGFGEVKKPATGRLR